MMDIEIIKLLSRCSKGSGQYNDGVKGFVEFAFRDKPADAKIHCPCETCVNTTLLLRDEIYEHLICNGMLENYDEWDFHGDPSVQGTSGQHAQPLNDTGRHANMHQLIHDTFGYIYDDIPMNDGTDYANPPVDGANSETQDFYKLVKDSEKPLWQGCELSELSLLVLLFNIKAMNKWSNKSFGDLLGILHMAIPNGNQLPKIFYEAKKVISKFGLGYEKIHACPNNCELFWKDKARDDFCSTCKASRWKGKEPETKLTDKERRKAIPCKVLQYFPIKERLKRMFMCKETAPLLRWHDEERMMVLYDIQQIQNHGRASMKGSQTLHQSLVIYGLAWLPTDLIHS